jgi:hypothetical protein
MLLKDFVNAHRIVMKSRRIEVNPYRSQDEDDKDKGQSHWECILTRQENGIIKKFVTYYSMGSAYTRPPTVEEVLDSLSMESQACESNFDDWCSDLGYSSDSLKALRTYAICQEIGGRFKRFLGKALMGQLTIGCERL